jgi:hypothetical protein
MSTTPTSEFPASARPDGADAQLQFFLLAATLQLRAAVRVADGMCDTELMILPCRELIDDIGTQAVRLLETCMTQQARSI